MVRLHQVQTALGDGLNNEGSEDRKKIVLRALFTDGMEKLPTTLHRMVAISEHSRTHACISNRERFYSQVEAGLHVQYPEC